MPSEIGRVEWLATDLGRLKAKIFAGVGSSTSLVVILHGDAPFEPPSYQYELARKLAAGCDGLVAAAILRPGYADAEGDRSEGWRGLATGDNYTPDIVAAIAQAVAALKDRYHGAELILMGYSGGAAIAAAVLATAPSLASRALLVSCPCDVPAWRQHMRSVAPTPLWDEPVESLAPMDLVSRFRRDLRLHILVGAEDSVTPPHLSLAFQNALARHGLDSVLTVLPGLTHEILDDPAILDAFVRLTARS